MNGIPKERAGRREWLGLAVLALPTLLVSLDMSVLFLALPRLSADLGADATEQLWILDSYGFGVAGFLVTMGTLGDRIGRRRLLLVGAAAFAVASVAAAYSPTPEVLIAARALLGVAGATLAPSTLALIRNMFADPRQRGTAIAVWMTCFMGGTAAGPLVGGVLLEWFWWGSVFLLAVPVMVVLLVAGPLLLPEYPAAEYPAAEYPAAGDRGPAAAGRLDLASVALSLAAILPVVYGLKELAKDGAAAGSGPVVAIVAGVVLGVVFVRRQRRLAAPLLDLRLFSRPGFGAALVVMFFGAVVMSGTFFFIPLYLQQVADLSPLRAGLWLVPQMLAMIATTQLAPYAARRVRPAYVMAAGLLTAAAGCLLLATVDSVGGVPLLVTGFLLACAGVAPPTALGTDLVVGAAPPEQAGAASSVSETGNELGVALGLAVMGSIGTAVYRDRFVAPAGLSGDAAETAREGINGAAVAAAGLPADVAADLLATARAAFTAGLNTVAVVGALVFLALTALALARLRHLPASGQPTPADPEGADDPAFADRR